MSQVDHTPQRVRSPAHPAFKLGKAIERAKTLYEAEDRHFAPMEALAVHWETKTTNSSFASMVSSLKQYGLLEEQVEDGSRRFRVTNLALDLIQYEEGTEQYSQSLKTAALNPSIHRELWEKYSGKLPSDSTLKIYLIRERPGALFNKDHVDAFIVRFRDAVSFSKLSSDDKPQVGDLDPEGEKGKNQNDKAKTPETPKPQTQKRREMVAGFKEDVFSLDEGSVVLQWPERISQTSAQDLQDWLELIGRKIKRAADAPPADPAGDDDLSDL